VYLYDQKYIIFGSQIYFTLEVEHFAVQSNHEIYAETEQKLYGHVNL